MQLGEPETLGVLDDHDRRVGDIDADLNDGRRDEHIDFAADECVHRLRLRVGLHPPVDQTDIQAVRVCSGQLRVQRNCRLQLELFRFLDQRAHPIHLMPLRADLAHAFDDLRATALAHELGRHRRAPGRHFVDHRQIKVSINAHHQ